MEYLRLPLIDGSNLPPMYPHFDKAVQFIGNNLFSHTYVTYFHHIEHRHTLRFFFVTWLTRNMNVIMGHAKPLMTCYDVTVSGRTHMSTIVYWCVIIYTHTYTQVCILHNRWRRKIASRNCTLPLILLILRTISWSLPIANDFFLEDGIHNGGVLVHCYAGIKKYNEKTLRNII